MTNFFSKLFGQKTKIDGQVEELLNTAMAGIIQHGNFNLEFSIEGKGEEIHVNLKGDDSGLVIDKDGMLLDGFQTYLKRLIQNRLPEQRVEIVVDCDGYLEAAMEDLKTLADQLKASALEKGQAYYVRALPPRDRKTIHRHLATDERVKSQSIGEGFCKKIKISPVGMKPRENNREGGFRNNNRNNNNRPNNGRNNNRGPRNNNQRNNRGPRPQQNAAPEYQAPQAFVEPVFDNENFGNRQQPNEVEG